MLRSSFLVVTISVTVSFVFLLLPAMRAYKMMRSAESFRQQNCRAASSPPVRPRRLALLR